MDTSVTWIDFFPRCFQQHSFHHYLSVTSKLSVEYWYASDCVFCGPNGSWQQCI